MRKLRSSKVFSYYLQTAKTGKELVLTLRIVFGTVARVEKQSWCYAIGVRITVRNVRVVTSGTCKTLPSE